MMNCIKTIISVAFLAAMLVTVLLFDVIDKCCGLIVGIFSRPQKPVVKAGV